MAETILNPKVNIAIHDHVRGMCYRSGDNPDEAVPVVKDSAPAYKPIIEPAGISWLGLILGGIGSDCGRSDSVANPGESKKDANKNDNDITQNPNIDDKTIADLRDTPSDIHEVEQETVVTIPDLETDDPPPNPGDEAAIEGVCDVYENLFVCSMLIKTGTISIKYSNQLRTKYLFSTEPTLYDRALPCYDGNFDALRGDNPDLCFFPTQEDLEAGGYTAEEAAAMGNLDYCTDLADVENRPEVRMTYFEAIDCYDQDCEDINQVHGEILVSQDPEDEAPLSEHLVGAKCLDRDETDRTKVNTDDLGNPLELRPDVDLNRAGASSFKWTLPQTMKHGDIHNIVFLVQILGQGNYYERGGTEEEPGYIPSPWRPIECTRFVQEVDE